MESERERWILNESKEHTGSDDVKSRTRMTFRRTPPSSVKQPEPQQRSPGGIAESRDEDGNQADGGITAAMLSQLSARIDQLAKNLEYSQLRDYVELTHKPSRLIFRNLVSGMSRGVGIAIGFTFFAATIVYILQMLGKLNLPIVGDYIADIVRIVQRQLQINPY